MWGWNSQVPGLCNACQWGLPRRVSQLSDQDVPGTESASSSSVAHVVPGSEIGSHKRLKEEVVPLVSSRQLRVLKHQGLG